MFKVTNISGSSVVAGGKSVAPGHSTTVEKLTSMMEFLRDNKAIKVERLASIPQASTPAPTPSPKAAPEQTQSEDPTPLTGRSRSRSKPPEVS
jgi:hypothetical protein